MILSESEKSVGRTQKIKNFQQNYSPQHYKVEKATKKYNSVPLVSCQVPLRLLRLYKRAELLNGFPLSSGVRY